jgi:hypothetical protein
MALQLTSAPHDHSVNGAGLDPSSFSLKMFALALTTCARSSISVMINVMINVTPWERGKAA